VAGGAAVSSDSASTDDAADVLLHLLTQGPPTGQAGYRFLLGAYLTQWLQVESFVNVVITLWFDPNEERNTRQLHDWVISELTMERRLQLLQLIGDHQSTDENVRLVLEKLRAANSRRNDFAHRIPTLDEETGTLKVGRPGKQKDVTLEQLRDETMSLFWLNGELGKAFSPLIPRRASGSTAPEAESDDRSSSSPHHGEEPRETEG
jgi:hypothetical protein